MKRFLVERGVRAAARRIGADADYTMALYDASPAALRSLGSITALLRHREAVPVDAAFAAQIVGALEEGCGPCVQIHINMARGAGVPDALIAAILRRDEASLPSDIALATQFALAIARRTHDEAELREAVRTRWGDKGVIDLVMAAQTSRFLSMLKSGFGYATACTALSVGNQRIVPESQPA